MALAGSQTGHLLVYRLRFGDLAVHIESAGAHGYFDVFATTAIAAAGGLLVAMVTMIGIAKLLPGATIGRRVSGQPLIDLLSILFTAQVAIFITQESAETLVGGTSFDPAIVFWAVTGQLPVAAVSAAALSMLFARSEGAIASLACRPSLLRSETLPVLVALPVAAPPMVRQRLRYGGRTDRGPPDRPMDLR